MTPTLSLTPEQQSAFAAHAMTWFQQEGISAPEGFELVVTANFRSKSPCRIEIGETDFDEILSRPLKEFLEEQIQAQRATRLLGSLLNLCEECRSATLGTLVRRPQHRLLRHRNFGRKGINLLSDILSRMGLTLGTAYPLGPKEKEVLREIKLPGTLSEWSEYPNIGALADNPPSLTRFTSQWTAIGGQYYALEAYLEVLDTYGISLR